MDFELDPADRRSIFLQIADAVRAAIARGDLATGSPLPPVRALAAQLGVHPNTVLQAYHELALHGTVQSRRGSGTFVRAAPPGDGERRVMADEVADRALRDAYAHGLTAPDLGAALDRAARRGAP